MGWITQPLHYLFLDLTAISRLCMQSSIYAQNMIIQFDTRCKYFLPNYLNSCMMGILVLQ